MSPLRGLVDPGEPFFYRNTEETPKQINPTELNARGLLEPVAFLRIYHTHVI